MYKRLSPLETIKLREQGWKDENPIVTSGDWKTAWQKQADAQGFVHKAPHFDPAKHLISPPEGGTYIARMQNLPNETNQNDVSI
jgi:hypothetical protein